MSQLDDVLKREIALGADVIDVGAGMAEYHKWLINHVRNLTLVDAHWPYLEEQRRRLREANNVRFVHGEAPGSLAHLVSVIERAPDRHDVCLGIDFIEHLELGQARLAIELMKQLATKVVLFVPEGHHPQTTDFFEMGGDHWQTHRSEWRRDDLERLGFEVEVWSDFHAGALGKDPGALFAVWTEPTFEIISEVSA